MGYGGDGDRHVLRASNGYWVFPNIDVGKRVKAWIKRTDRVG